MNDLLDEEAKLDQLTKKLALCEAERDEYLEGWKRNKADLANFKRETEERQKELANFAIIRLLEELIPVLDSFELATNNASWATVDEGWRTGVTHIQSQVISTLNNYGLAECGAEGDKFDPKYHEVTDTQEVESADKDNIIINVKQKGYKLRDRVIRPAKVVVGHFTN